MQHFKHALGSFATPLMIAFVIVLVAAGFRMRSRRRVAGRLVLCALAVVYVGALMPVGNALLAPLETAYPPLRADAAFQGIGYVVVLGSSYVPRDGIPVTAALDEDGLVRIVEGLRLARHFGALRLVVSGGAMPGFTPGALGYAKLAREFGVMDTSLVVLDSALDTSQEAHAIKAFLGASAFILVTSAYHMPRAMRLMQRAGAHPIAAPTGQRVGAFADTWLRPTSAAMRNTELALHEYLGLAALAAGIP